MKDMQDDGLEDLPDLLAGWISREQLARALGLTADTLARWEARRQGPPGRGSTAERSVPAGGAGAFG